jgi:hypothetical protein
MTMSPSQTTCILFGMKLLMIPSWLISFHFTSLFVSMLPSFYMPISLWSCNCRTKGSDKIYRELILWDQALHACCLFFITTMYFRCVCYITQIPLTSLLTHLAAPTSTRQINSHLSILTWTNCNNSPRTSSLLSSATFLLYPFGCW